MEAGAKTLIDTIMKPENLYIVIGVWILITTLHRVVPELKSKAWWARVQPVLPLVLCNAAMWLPGVAQAEMSTGDKFILGTILGFSVGHAHKVVKQFGFGQDERIKNAKLAKQGKIVQ